MGVTVTFKSGKTINLKGATGFKSSSETFHTQAGKAYKAQGYVIFFGKGKKPIHYKQTSVRSINKT